AEMFIGTIHAFCLELLKSEVPEYLKYEVLNDVQQKLFLDRNSKKSGLTTSTDLTVRPLRRFVDTNNFCSADSILREGEIDPRALRGCSVYKALDQYHDLLEAKRYFDYSAILEAAVDTLIN